MKIKFIIILITILSINSIKAQDLYLFGTYEVTFECEDNTAVFPYKIYYVFDGEGEELGFTEYRPTRSMKKYYAVFLGNYSLSDNKLTIEKTTDGGSGNPFVRIINGKPETYTVKSDFVLKSNDGNYIVLGNNKECENFEVTLKKLNEKELEEFYDNLN